MASSAKAAAAPRELIMTRVLDAAPRAVFEAWTDPAQMAQWFGPPNGDVEILALNPRPGGNYRFNVRNQDGQLHTVGGIYREVTPHSRLVFTWQWETQMGDPAAGLNAEMLVTVTFKPQGKQTEMTLHQINIATDFSRERHSHGWTGCFDKLVVYLAKTAHG